MIDSFIEHWQAILVAAGAVLLGLDKLAVVFFNTVKNIKEEYRKAFK